MHAQTAATKLYARSRSYEMSQEIAPIPGKMLAVLWVLSALFIALAQLLVLTQPDWIVNDRLVQVCLEQSVSA